MDNIIIIQEGTLKYLIEYLYRGNEHQSTDNHIIITTYRKFAVHDTSNKDNKIERITINIPDRTIIGCYHTSVISKCPTKETIDINDFSLYRILNGDNLGKIIIQDFQKKIDTTSLERYQIPGCFILPIAIIKNRIEMHRIPLPYSNILQDINYILLNGPRLVLKSIINYGPSYFIYDCDADIFQGVRCGRLIPIHIKKQSTIRQRPLDEIVLCDYCTGQIFGYFYIVGNDIFHYCPICAHTSSTLMINQREDIIIEFTPRTIDEHYRWKNDKLRYIYNRTKIYTDIRSVPVTDHNVILIDTPMGNVIITDDHNDITNGSIKEYNPTDIFIFQNLLN